jgi:hypothetical protein
VIALLGGLLVGGWVGGGLVWVFNRTAYREAAGQVADVSLGGADELALVPADAAAFAHVRAADMWKTDAMADVRQVLGKAGDDALKALDESFAPAPSTLDRVTVVAMKRAVHPQNLPNLGKQPAIEIKGGKKVGGFQPPPFQPPPPPPGGDLDVVGLLTFTAPFDFDKVRAANVPKAQVQKVGDKELWSDASGLAVSASGNRTLVVGPTPAVRAFLLKPRAADGPLAPALQLAASGSRHLVAGVGMKSGIVPPDLTRGLPPEAAAVLRADALAVGMVLGRGMKLDLRAAYKDAAAAEEAEAALRKGAESGRKSLAEAKAKMRDKLALKPGATRPVEELPEAVAGVFALGALTMADEWLEKPPLRRDGAGLEATVTVESVGSAYATTAAMSVGLMLPAIQKVREAAGRMQDANNLKQMAIAMHAYEGTYNRLPAAAIADQANNPRAKALLSWRVAVLPYVGEEALFERFNLDEPWDSEHNRALIPLMPKIYASPRAPAPPGKTHYQVLVAPDNAFPGTMFGRVQGKRFSEITDGLSSTIMIVEAPDPVDWTKPEDVRYDPKGPPPRLGLPGAGGFNAAMGDGSVRFFPSTLNPQTLHHLIQNADGMVIPPID